MSLILRLASSWPFLMNLLMLELRAIDSDLTINLAFKFGYVVDAWCAISKTTARECLHFTLFLILRSL